MCTLIAALAGVVAVEAFVNWVFRPHGIGTFRALLVVVALGFVVGALRLREGRRRHAVQLVNAAGLASLVLALTSARGHRRQLGAGPVRQRLRNRRHIAEPRSAGSSTCSPLGFGLVAYAAVDGEAGPAYIGVAVLLAFGVMVGLNVAGRGSLVGWPLFLLVIGGAGLLIGLRPRRELPPPPGGEHRRLNRADVRGGGAMSEKSHDEAVQDAVARALTGGPDRHRAKAAEQGKLPVRERVQRLLDPDSFTEDGLLASWEKDGLGAEGVVTGLGSVGGRTVAVMANDPTVKAGSWAPKTVEKILRIQERALSLRAPIVYLVDSAGARIDEQVQMFPGRRHAGRIFFNQVRLSGVVPQICVLFGPSAAGGAYIPAFCDIVIMRDGNASMYLGSPRMAEMVIGEKVSLEEMGGARMHTSRSGVGHALVASDEEGIDFARRYLSYFPSSFEGEPPIAAPAAPASQTPIVELIPEPTRTSRSTCACCSTRSWTPTRSSRSTPGGRRS